MYIDLGQRSFGAMHRCALCGMEYVKGDVEDVRSHAKHCKQTQALPLISSLKGHNISETFETDSVIKVTSNTHISRGAIGATIAAVLLDLGSDEGLITPSDSIFLYILGNGEVVGCLVAEEIPRTRAARISSAEEAAHILVPLPTQQQGTHRVGAMGARAGGAGDENGKRDNRDSNLTREGTGIESDVAVAEVAGKVVEEEVEAEGGRMLGVKLMWTAPQHRRQHRAHRLLDTARRCLTYGRLYSPAQVGFSQPTQEGFNFACGYCAGRVWAY